MRVIAKGVIVKLGWRERERVRYRDAEMQRCIDTEMH